MARKRSVPEPDDLSEGVLRAVRDQEVDELLRARRPDEPEDAWLQDILSSRGRLAVVNDALRHARPNRRGPLPGTGARFDSEDQLLTEYLRVNGGRADPPLNREVFEGRAPVAHQTLTSTLARLGGEAGPLTWRYVQQRARALVQEQQRSRGRNP